MEEFIGSRTLASSESTARRTQHGRLSTRSPESIGFEFHARVNDTHELDAPVH